MNTRTWSPEDRREFDAAVAEAWDGSDTQRERTRAFLAGVVDAAQARRFWASDVQRECEYAGAAGLLKRQYKMNNQVAVSYSGEIVSKSRVGGAVEQTDDGGRVYYQTLFDLMTREQLQDKRQECLRSMKAYGRNLGQIDKYLALLDMAPGANTPAEAAQWLGTTVGEYLAGAA